MENYFINMEPFFWYASSYNNLEAGKLLVGEITTRVNDGLGVFYMTKRVYGRVKSCKISKVKSHKKWMDSSGLVAYQEIVLDNGMRIYPSLLHKANLWIET